MPSGRLVWSGQRSRKFRPPGEPKAGRFRRPFRGGRSSIFGEVRQIRYHDGHVHFFPSPLKNAIDQWFSREGWSLYYHGQQADTLLSAAREDGAEEMAVLIYAHKPGMAHSLNAWLYQWGQRHSGLHLFGTVHPDDSDLEREVVQCLDEWKFTGFKVHANVQRVMVDDDRLTPLMEALIARGRGLIVHAGREPHTNPYVGWRPFARLMARYPQLKVQVAHLGFDEIQEFLSLARDYPFLYFDTAAIPGPRFPLSSQALTQIIETIPDRIIYGSDLPILEEPVARHRDRIRAVIGDAGLLEHVFHQNAVRFWHSPTL